MPVNCSSSVLTGADGLVTFSPAGARACLEKPDMPAGADIITGNANFRVGDPVTLTYPDGATPDTNLSAGDYFIVAAADSKVSVSASAGGTPITLDGAFDPLDGTHAELEYSGTEPVCSVQEWSLSLTKQTADVTTLPCSVGDGGGKVAPVRKQQGTFLEGEGSMTILFTGDQTSIGMRLLQDSIMVDSRVYAKLYILAVAGAGGAIEDDSSMHYAGYVNLLGFSITVNTSDAIAAEVNFAVADTPDAIFGVKV